MMLIKKAFILSSLFFCISLLQSCEDEPAITPKPRGFPKVVYPQKAYQSFIGDYCDFTFEYPTYAKIEQDQRFFEKQLEEDCWFDIVIPEFDARVHCSYAEIAKGTSIDKLKSDAFELVQKHNVKAKYIEEIKVETSEGRGFLFNLEGEVATPFQFFLTDERKHFLRGSLYFNTQVAPDSLAPIFDFVKSDIEHMVRTIVWKD